MYFRFDQEVGYFVFEVEIFELICKIEYVLENWVEMGWEGKRVIFVKILK